MLLARSQFASGRSCNLPPRSRFSVVFLDPRANAELESKFHFALHASHVALPILDPNFTIIQPFQNHKKKNKKFRSYALPLPEGRTGTAWELSRPEISSPPPTNVVSLFTSPLPFSSFSLFPELLVCISMPLTHDQIPSNSTQYNI
jgi:hypothetical protein